MRDHPRLLGYPILRTLTFCGENVSWALVAPSAGLPLRPSSRSFRVILSSHLCFSYIYEAHTPTSNVSPNSPSNIFSPKSKRWGPCSFLDRSIRSRIRRLRQPSPIAAAHPRIARSRRGETIPDVGVLKSFVFTVSNAAPRARPCAGRSSAA